jgi:L-arabinose transport system substrate-binding protein
VNRNTIRRLAAVTMAALATLALAACSDGQSGEVTGGGVDVKKLAYIVKFGSVPYFVQENKGVQRASDKLGITTSATDVKDDSDAAVSAVDTAIAQGAQGLIVVAPNQNLGPVIASKAATAGIPVIAVDDPLMDGNGNALPFVGFDAASIGEQVGTELGRLMTKEGVNPAKVKVASIEDQKTPVCMTRNKAAQTALEKSMPGITGDNVIHVPYNNDLDSAINAMATVATSNPDVDYWAIYSCNDAGVAGAWRALSTHAVTGDKVFGVGIGGEYACQIFKAEGNRSGFRATYAVDSALHGEKAVELLHAFLKDGTKIPARTILPGMLANAENFKDVVVDCD